MCSKLQCKSNFSPEWTGAYYSGSLHSLWALSGSLPAECENICEWYGACQRVSETGDENRDFYKRLNKELVSFEDVSNKYDVLELKGLIQEHVAYTNSEKGKRILDHFSEYLPKFKKIVPHDYRRMMNAIVQMEEKGLNSEQAQIEAFYANIRG